MYYPNYYPYYQPQQNQNPGIVWISNEREAALYPVAPNNAVTLWSQNEPVVYLKTADATGRPTLKTYDLVERVEQKEHNFVTKDELSTVVNAITSLTKEVENLRTRKVKIVEDENE